MQFVSVDLEILGQLDPLKENEPVVVRKDPISGCEIYQRSYYSDNLYITTYASGNELNIEAIFEVYEVLNEGAPDYLKAFKKDDKTVIIAWPRYEDKFEDATYTLLIEEIIRISAFLLKEFGIDAAKIYIQNYLNMCVANGED